MGRLSRFGWRPVGPPRRPVLFVNQLSGGGRAARARVAERARERGIDVTGLDTPQSLGDLVRGAVAEGADALGVAGGDGSLAVVAAAGTGTRAPVRVYSRGHPQPFRARPYALRTSPLLNRFWCVALLAEWRPRFPGGLLQNGH
jgi:hypothetical protein